MKGLSVIEHGHVPTGYRNRYVFYTVFAALGVATMAGSIFVPPVDWIGSVMGLAMVLGARAFWSSVDVSNVEANPLPRLKMECAAVGASLVLTFVSLWWEGLADRGTFVMLLVMPVAYLYRNFSQLHSLVRMSWRN